MLGHSPTTPATRPGLHSAVVCNSFTLQVVSILLLGWLLMVLAALLAVVGIWPQVPVPGGLLGLVLLGLAGRTLARGNRPMLLTSRRAALHLEPVGRSRTQGMPAETIPLASVRAYTYWARPVRYGVFLQYHLRFELADGQVLHLADRPSTRPDDPADAVRLDAVARQLPHWVAPGTPRRPCFTRAAPPGGYCG